MQRARDTGKKEQDTQSGRRLVRVVDQQCGVRAASSFFPFALVSAVGRTTTGSQRGARRSLFLFFLFFSFSLSPLCFSLCLFIFSPCSRQRALSGICAALAGRLIWRRRAHREREHAQRDCGPPPCASKEEEKKKTAHKQRAHKQNKKPHRGKKRTWEHSFFFSLIRFRGKNGMPKSARARGRDGPPRGGRRFVRVHGPRGRAGDMRAGEAIVVVRARGALPRRRSSDGAPRSPTTRTRQSPPRPPPSVLALCVLPSFFFPSSSSFSSSFFSLLARAVFFPFRFFFLLTFPRGSVPPPPHLLACRP